MSFRLMVTRAEAVGFVVKLVCESLKTIDNYTLVRNERGHFRALQ